MSNKHTIYLIILHSSIVLFPSNLLNGNQHHDVTNRLSLFYVPMHCELHIKNLTPTRLYGVTGFLCYAPNHTQLQIFASTSKLHFGGGLTH